MRRSLKIGFLSLFVFASLGCGVKGKPLPPLKKGETQNQSQQPKSP